jgi:PAS domain S-box-containing protein
MQRFFEFCNEMLCVADSRGYFTRVNPAWTKTLGWSTEEMTSRPFIDFVHPDDVETTKREARLLHSGTHETILFDNRYRCRDGSYRWLSWQAKLVPETNELIATARDVTTIRLQTEALRTAEQAAKDSEARLLLALEAGRLGIWSWDLATNRVHSSETQALIHGRSADQTETEIGSEGNIHPDDREIVRTAIERVISNEAADRITYRVVWPDESIHWIEAVGRVFCDQSGKPTHVTGVCADITERKHAEDALRASEERFRQLAMHAPVGIAQSDAEGRTFFVNPKWCELAGAGLEEPMDYGWQKFIHPEDRAHLIESWQADMAAGKTFSPSHFRLIRKDGTIRWVSGMAALIRDVAGTPIGQIGVTVDVTEQKTAEVALKTEQELLRNLIEVQEKEKQFLCHEFHDGLIQYSFGSAMLLESCRSNPLAPDNASKIDTVITNLRRGVEDGRRVIRGVRPAVLDDSGLEAAMEDLVGQYESSGIHVTCKCDPKIGRLPETIQTTVYRVVQEALNNASKYSGTDVVRIELKKTNDDLLLEIRDFGCGFDVPAARKKGFGLLGMTERVRLLGGECLIESEQDVGTTISVSLTIPGGR